MTIACLPVCDSFAALLVMLTMVLLARSRKRDDQATDQNKDDN